jgi:hypothetical protein
MRRSRLALAILSLAGAAAPCSSAADVPTTAVAVARAKVAGAEKLIDNQLASMYPDEPWFLLGPARGVYLEGFGVVFTAEVNLATGPVRTPFHMEITKEEIAKHRDKKLSRLPQLRLMMATILGSATNALDTLPASGQVVLGVTLLRYPYEDPKGIPSQIVMQAERGKLLDAQRRGVPLNTVIKVQEY